MGKVKCEFCGRIAKTLYIRDIRKVFESYNRGVLKNEASFMG